MIYTITLNPSVDYIVEVEDFQLGSLNRVGKDMKFPGGKGINVSRVLKRLNAESRALGFVGGFTGRYVSDFLALEMIETDFITVSGDTRINIKLKTSSETEINGQGPHISSEQIEELLWKISALTTEDLVVMAGSIPGSIPKTFYKDVAALCEKKKIPFVVDTSGSALMDVIEHKPFLIKPNHHELGEIFQTTIESVEDAVQYGKKLVEMGAVNVIVSMAEKGALLISSSIVIQASPPKGTVKNSVGAGDSLVGGFLASLIKDRDLKKAFQNGVAAGSATAFSEDLCTKTDVDKLLGEVRIMEV